MTGRPQIIETGSSHRYVSLAEAGLLVSAADAIAPVAAGMGYEQYLLFGLSREPEQGEVGTDVPFRATIEAQGRKMAAIARELHDDTVQDLANALTELVAVASEAGLREEARTAIASASDSIDHALGHILELSCALYPPVIDVLGLSAALRNLITKMCDDYPVDIRLVTIGRESDLPSEVKLGLYRIAQEALHDVVVNTGAREGVVCVGFSDDGIDLVIEGDASGFIALPTADGRSHLGLASMLEHTVRIGGTFDCRIGERGMTVKVHVPR